MINQGQERIVQLCLAVPATGHAQAGETLRPFPSCIETENWTLITDLFGIIGGL